MVDVQVCGDETKDMNIYTDDQVNKRKIQCGSN